MTTNSHPFHVRQEVLLFDGVDRSRRKVSPTPVVITRVGRVNVAIERAGREVQFDIKDGVEKRSARAIGEPSVIRTYEQWEQDQHRDEVFDELRALGIEFPFGRGREFSTDALTQVRDILAADKAQREV